MAGSEPTPPPSGPPVALVHDSHRFDGHRILALQYRDAIRAAGRPIEVYTCVDPSTRSSFEVDGSEIPGRWWPGGGRVEMALNRLGGRYAEAIARLPGAPVHLMSVHLARALDRRADVALSLIDLAKLNTAWYPRSARLLHNWLLRRAPRARAIVTATEWVRADVLRSLRVTPDQVVVAPPFAPTGVRTNRPPAFGEAPLRLLYVAVDRPHKNVGAFLELIRRLGPGFHGTWVGEPGARTAARIRDAALGDRFHVVRAAPGLDEVYSVTDVLVHPSYYEGFGLPVLEAMARGIPVVAARATSLPEVVGNGGATVAPDDPDGWVEAVRRLADPAEWRAAQSRALERAGAFTPDRTWRGLSQGYALAAGRSP